MRTNRSDLHARVALAAVLLSLLAVLPAVGAGAAVPTGTISGMVRDPDGDPVVGVDVMAESVDGETLGEDATRADGTYEISGLPAGAYYMAFFPAQGSGLAYEFYEDAGWMDEWTEVVVTAGATTTIDAELGLAATITGSVAVDGGDPLDFPSTVFAESTNGDWNFGFVEPDGSYVIEALVGGDYYVSVEEIADPGLVPAIWEDAEMPADADLVSVAAGDTAADIDFTLRRCEAPFSDVPASHQFCVPIEWVDTAGVATGFPDGTYRPRRSVSRGAMAAFLWRQAGAPGGPFPTSEFTDVPDGHPFATAIAWMDSEGISTGFPDGTFRPDIEVTRGGTAAFLWRVAGEPSVSIGPFPPGICFFDDVCEDHPFFEPILWMVFSGITDGYDDFTFRPGRPVSRQAMASFLHRYQTAAEWNEIFTDPPGFGASIGDRSARSTCRERAGLAACR